MKITTKLLQQKKACGDGLRWFNKHFPEGGDINSVLVMVLTDDDASKSWVSWLMTATKWTDLSFLKGLALTDLYLSGTQITALPEGLSVGGYLDLRGTQITALPEGLSVGGYLDLSGVNITNIPAKFKSKIIH